MTSEAPTRKRVGRSPEPSVIGQWGEFYECPITGNRKVRLTAEGKRVLEDWVARHPNPTALLRWFDPVSYHRCQQLRFSPEEIHSACLEGYVRGVIRHQDERATLRTSMAFAVRSSVQNMLRVRSKQNREFVWESHWYKSSKTEEMDVMDYHRIPDRHAGEYAGWLMRKAKLSDRDRQVMCMYYGDGLTLEEIGDVFGVTWQCMYYVVKRSMERVKKTVQRIETCEVATC